MFRHLLIATDGSEHAKLAVSHGLALAQALSAKATVLRVSGERAHISVAGIELTALPAEVETAIAREIEQSFAWARQEADRLGVSCETLRRQSERPWQGILAAAAEVGADLVVMARHGRATITRMVGSETERVLRGEPPIPVLIVQ